MIVVINENLHTKFMNDELWLMHGEVEVAKLSFNDTGQIHSVIRVIEPDHIPPGIEL